MERIQLLHPAGKKGVTMESTKYEILSTALLVCLKEKKVASFQELEVAVSAYLFTQNVQIAGKLGWNLFWVTLHLEAINKLDKDSTASPIQYALSE